MQTMDFEEPDGPILQKHYREKTRKSRALEEFFNYVLAATITLLTTGIFIGVFNGTERFLNFRINMFASKVEENRVLMAVLLAIGTSLIVAIVPALFIIIWTPNAIGSGMGDVISFLNGNNSFQEETFTLTTFGRLLGVFGIVCAGLFSGIDGPLARVGCGIAIEMVKVLRKSETLVRLFYGNKPTSKNSKEEHDLTSRISWESMMAVLENTKMRMFATIGASVGIAAAFRAPFGGVMFAVEEATSFFEPSLLIRTLFATMISYIMFPRGEVGPDLEYLSTRSRTLFPKNTDCERSTANEDYFIYILLGIIAATLSMGWNRLMGLAQKFRLKHIITDIYTTNRRRRENNPPLTKKFGVAAVRLLEVAIVCVLTNFVVVLVPLAPGVDQCLPNTMPLDHIDQLISWDCQQSFVNSNDSVYDGCLKTLRSVCLQYDMSTLYLDNLSSFHDKLKARHGALASRDTIWDDFQTGNKTLVMSGFATKQGARKVNRRRTLQISANKAFTVNPSTFGQGIDGNEITADSTPHELHPPFNKSFVYEALLRKNEKEECYYPLRSLFYSTPDRTLRLLLTRGFYNVLSPRSLVIFFIIYMIFVVACYYIALPTDLVVPDLILGSCAGRLFGWLVNKFKAATNTGMIDPGLYALLGLAGFWSGTSRLVIAVSIIALELTGDFESLPALLLVTFTSAWFSSFLESLGWGESLYHSEMTITGTPFLPQEPPHYLRYVSISQIDQKRDGLIWLSVRKSTYGTCAKAVESKHSGFPIVEEVKVKNRDVDVNRVGGGNGGQQGRDSVSDSISRSGTADELTIADSMERYTVKYRPVGFIERARLDEALKLMKKNHLPEESLVDLIAIGNVSPTIVPRYATASKIFKIMRTLGLRHVLLVDDDGWMCGLVSRSDILAWCEEQESRLLVEKNENSRRWILGICVYVIVWVLKH
ncbi:hypothetical protein HDU76_013217 [Blyttiomyces sp. JEL0837]|nr:hypothetical protein HDU76_013217 [Blyttiomyces sp. JEL0837]